MRRASLLGAAAGFVPFVLVLFDFGWNPLRTAGEHRFGSNFYDLQARAFLDGDLALPDGSLGIEGFVVGGRTYMYFPPFPALLRIPVFLATDRLDGRLTAMSMLLAWIVLAAAAGTLFWAVRRVLRPGADVSRGDALACTLFVATVTGATTVVFDASLPWVYHEVYVWAVALSVATAAGLVGLVLGPSTPRVVVTSLCAIAAVLTRTTAGWAMAGAVIVTGVVVAVRSRPRVGAGITLAVGGIVAIATGAALNWAKFRHPYMFPLEHQVWTDVNARRRLALAINGGTITGPQFFPTAVVNYLRPDGIRFVPYFPFVTLPAHPARSYAGAFVDQAYRTGGVPAFMPLPTIAALWGLVRAGRIRPLHRLAAVAVPIAGAAAITGGVLFYGYFAHRYTNEFVPVLVVAGAVAFADAPSRLAGLRRAARVPIVAGALALAVFGAYAHVATGYATARATWKGDRLAGYVAAQERVSGWFGGDTADLVSWSPSVPLEAPTDDLVVVGACDALLLGSGDQYEPWLTVEMRDLTVEVHVGEDGTSPGIARLFTMQGATTRNVTLETGDGDRVRLRIGEGWIFLPTPWYSVEPGTTFEVSLLAEPERDRYRLLVGDVFDEHFPLLESDQHGVKRVAIASFDLPGPSVEQRLGVTLTSRPGPALELCERVASGIDR